MTRNTGTIDRLARAFLVAPAATIAAFALGLGSPDGVALLVVAAIMVATAAASGLDRAAFEALVASEAPGLYPFALSLVRNADAAEELVQDTFVRCRDARRDVSDYLDGVLPDERRRLVERHLATCPTCPPLHAALVGVKTELGSLRDLIAAGACAPGGTRRRGGRGRTRARPRPS
jgi:hypothetical protein